MSDEICTWTFNEDYSYFDASCGAAWYFEHISPDEVPSKTLRFCPTCGAKIQKAQQQSTDSNEPKTGGME